MLRRRAPLRFLAPLLAALLLLLAARPARAHRLEADYRVLPDGRVQIESWFDLTGDSPKGARVEVLRADGRVVTDGKLDDKGVFVFSPPPDAGSLHVAVVAGAGHRKDLVIPAAELGTTTPGGPESIPPPPFADRSSRVTLKDVLTGVGFVLALAAFVLSLRNARRLREWEQAGTRAGLRDDGSRKP